MATAPSSSQDSKQPNPKMSDDAVPGDQASNREKDPKDWVTGDEPMTGAQASYLKTLSEQANEPFDAKLNKGDASKRIDALRQKNGVDKANA